MKLIVSIPFANHSVMSFITKKALADLKLSEKYEVEYRIVQGSNIVRTRNLGINGERSVAKKQKLSGFDYILFLDSDIGFTVEHVDRLISHNLPIVGGAYQKRETLEKVCAGSWSMQPGLCRTEDCLPWDSKGLHKVDWSGAGFMLMSREALESMEYPWFRYEMVEYEVNDEVCKSCTSDDFGFCMNAANAGLDVYVDCDCKAEHLSWKVSEITPDLPNNLRLQIVDEEMGKLEIELYRAALKAAAMERMGKRTSEEHKRLEPLRALKSTLIHEMETLKKSSMRLDA